MNEENNKKLEKIKQNLEDVLKKQEEKPIEEIKTVKKKQQLLKANERLI